MSDADTATMEGDTLTVTGGESVGRYSARELIAALLIYVARGDGQITAAESGKMLDLVGEHFALSSPSALQLLNAATENLVDRPDLMNLLGILGRYLSDDQKEGIALALLRIIASDGRKDAEEIDALSVVADAMSIKPESMHSAFDRYFDQR